MPVLREKVRAAEDELRKRQEKAAAVEAATAARQETAAVREESTRAMSDAGLLMMVEKRLKLQGRFDNSSDTSENIWKRIHHFIEEAVNKDDLPRGDLRSQKALEKRYATEWGEFKLWCAKATRAITFSGVPADEVEDKVKEHQRVTRRRSSLGTTLACGPWPRRRGRWPATQQIWGALVLLLLGWVEAVVWHLKVRRFALPARPNIASRMSAVPLVL